MSIPGSTAARLNSHTDPCTHLASLVFAFPKTFTGLAVLRFLLGASESVVTPGFALITARFYTRQEQPLRMALWYCCNGLGSTIGGLLGKRVTRKWEDRSREGNATQGTDDQCPTLPGYGVGHIYVPSIENWAWIFIVNGA